MALTSLALATIAVLAGPTASGQEPIARVKVDLVQVEVVVADARGNRVADLTSDEMEVFENGQRRRITHFSFIPERPRELLPSAAVSVTTRQASAPPAAAPEPISPVQAARVMAIVVDDLGMDEQSFSDVRRALESFLARDVQPGDLVALIATSGRLGGLARLTNDRRLLRAALERFRSLPNHRIGVRERLCASGPALPMAQADPLAQAYYGRLTVAALRRVVDGLRRLPGRKSILLFSEGLPLMGTTGFGKFSHGLIDRKSDFGEVDRGLMDDYEACLAHAGRSGVAVNTIDPRGLTGTARTAEDPGVTDDCIEARRMELVYTQHVLADMAGRTAGVAITGDNDLPAAITRVERDQAGYYLVAWRPTDEPPAKPAKGAPRVRNLSIRLKRPGLKARFHSSLYAEEPPEASPVDGAHRLAEAILSPFAAPDIRVRVSSRFWDADGAAGSVLDTVLRIDARDCAFTTESDGRRKADIHLIAAIWGAEEKPLDTFERSYAVSLTPAAYERALAEGLVQRLQMRVKRPGAYQIRAAVRDRQAERLGSASDFVEVPDLNRRRLALSGIALMGAASNDAADSGTRLRYRRGETVAYTFQILNSDAGRERVEVRATLYRGGRELGASAPVTVEGRGQADPKRWIVKDSFRLGDRLPPGEYALQVTVVDRSAPAKPASAAQLAEFEVVE